MKKNTDADSSLISPLPTYKMDKNLKSYSLGNRPSSKSNYKINASRNQQLLFLQDNMKMPGYLKKIKNFKENDITDPENGFDKTLTNSILQSKNIKAQKDLDQENEQNRQKKAIKRVKTNKKSPEIKTPNFELSESLRMKKTYKVNKSWQKDFQQSIRKDNII